MSNNISSVNPLADAGISNFSTEIKDKKLDVKGDALLNAESDITGQKLASLNQNKAVTEDENKVKEQNVEESEFEQALDLVSNFVQSTLKDVDFVNDDNSGKTIITVVDKETSEVISQFPSESILKMAEKIKDLQEEITNVSGLLIDDVV